LLPPVDGRMEVWAAGVTYARSREARMEESSVADVYERVYGAERPELFFKAVPWRVVTDDEPIAIRRDSELNVPEAELAVVLNSVGETIGFTVCNDVSSRTIEGENPLYLPQAKVYAGSCALSSAIRPAWELDGGNLEITLEVRRDREIAWSGRVSTGQLRRTPAELSAFLFEEEQFPDGVILSTGTGIVPEMEFTLAVGDVVSITVDQVGTLSNHVVAGKGELAWLAVTKGGLRRAPLAPS
jgi:2-dehydro-3-deoxy-D-arabinonate dehydratase